MVSFNMLWKLGVVMAFGLSATATSTEVAQEQPKKESLDSGSLRNNQEHTTEPQDIQELPKYSLEWYFVPKPENRAQLLEKLPFDVAKDVPKNCDEPIDAALEKRIRRFFSLRGLIFTSMSSYPLKMKEPGYTDCLELGETSGPPKYSLEWYLLPKPENRKHLRERLPLCSLKCLPDNCEEPLNPKYAKRIKEYFLVYPVEWYLLSKEENRTALRYVLPEDLAEKVPEDCNEPITPEVEKDIREHFLSLQMKMPKRFFSYY